MLLVTDRGSRGTGHRHGYWSQTEVVGLLVIGRGSSGTGQRQG